MEQVPARIAGRPFTNGRWMEVSSPYSGEVVAAVPACGSEEVEAACARAAEVLRRDGFPQVDRARVLEVAAAKLRDRVEEFARTIALEAGKPIRTARSEVVRCVDTLTFAAVEARTLSGELLPMEASDSGAGKLGLVLRVPIGVVAAISPFNFPLNLVAHKVAPAVAAGCPVVLKPADQTPLTALRLVDLLVESGLPEDWVSVVTGTGEEAGEPLVDHPVPAMVTFTGSVPVGWGIAARAPRKRVALELGSNSPLIVEPDAVAAKVAASAYAYAGQSCISTQRVLVHRSVHEALVERLRIEAEAIRVGDPLDEDTDVGPVIAPEAAARIRGWIDAAVAGGGRLVAGGDLEGEALLRPAVVDQPPPDADLCRLEAFGPVVVVLPYDDFDEAIDLANDSEFGLHVGLFTSNLDTALRAVRELDFGGVLVNEVPTYRADQQPYGGVRDAGNTREGPAYAVREMTELRFVSFQPAG
ncbi:MAG: aldehyde dehydrogenase family protein [Nitriliruptorales bacterium]